MKDRLFVRLVAGGTLDVGDRSIFHIDHVPKWLIMPRENRLVFAGRGYLASRETQPRAYSSKNGERVLVKKLKILKKTYKRS